MKKALALSTLIALGFGVNAMTATAQDAPGAVAPQPAQMMDFATLDADKDGKVTAEELLAHRTAQFAAADADKDGALSLEELTAWTEAQRAARMQTRMQRMLTALDADKDGTLSPEEMTARMGDGSRFLERMDSDDDGAISEEEFAQLDDMRARGRDMMRDRMKGERGGRMMDGERAGRMMDGERGGHRHDGEHGGHGKEGRRWMFQHDN